MININLSGRRRKRGLRGELRFDKNLRRSSAGPYATTCGTTWNWHCRGFEDQGAGWGKGENIMRFRHLCVLLLVIVVAPSLFADGTISYTSSVTFGPVVAAAAALSKNPI